MKKISHFGYRLSKQGAASCFAERCLPGRLSRTASTKCIHEFTNCRYCIHELNSQTTRSKIAHKSHKVRTHELNWIWGELSESTLKALKVYKAKCARCQTGDVDSTGKQIRHFSSEPTEIEFERIQVIRLIYLFIN